VPNARWSVIIDDGDARATLQRLRDDIERTGQFVSSRAFKTGDVFGAGGTSGRGAADDIAAKLGVARSDVITAVRQSNLLLGPGGQPVRFGGGEPGGASGGGRFGLESHSIGLQSVAHSARAVADTYTYRVSPAISEVHRAAAGFLAFSVPGFGALAAIGLSAATVIGVNLFGSLLKAREGAQEVQHAFATALSPGGDVGPASDIVKKRTAEIITLNEQIKDVDRQIALYPLSKNPPAEQAMAVGLLEFQRSFQLGRLQKERNRLEQERIGAEEAIAPEVRKALATKIAQDQAKEERELARLAVTEQESGNKAAFALAQDRVREQFKLAEGERAIRVARSKGIEEFAEGEARVGAISLNELQGVRRGAIESKRAEELAGANAEANKRRAELEFQRSDIESQIATRRKYLEEEGARLTRPQIKKEELEIAEREAKARALQAELADVEAERAQKGRSIAQQAGFDLAKDSQRRIAEDLQQEEARFQLKRSLREASLQDELAHIQLLIGRTAEGSSERLRLEKEFADKKNQIRDQSEGGAIGILGEAGALLKSRGVTAATPEQFAAAFGEISQTNRETLRNFGAGGAADPDAVIKALRFQSQLRGLGDLGVQAGDPLSLLFGLPGGGNVGGFLQGTAAEGAGGGSDAWGNILDDRAKRAKADYDRLYGGGGSGDRPKLGFGAGAETAGGDTEATIRQQLGLGAISDGYKSAFDGAMTVVTDFGQKLKTELDSINSAAGESIADRVLAKLREILYRDNQRN
jgi:hypothetical protein